MVQQSLNKAEKKTLTGMRVQRFIKYQIFVYDHTYVNLEIYKASSCISVNGDEKEI